MSANSGTSRCNAELRPLREPVLWTLVYESTARAEEVLLLNVSDLDTANRRAVVIRKGGARDVIVWQTGTARLLPGRKTGPVFLTDRKARPLGARSGHTAVRSLAKYARVSAEALGPWQAEPDPAGRRAGSRR